MATAVLPPSVCGMFLFGMCERRKVSLFVSLRERSVVSHVRRMFGVWNGMSLLIDMSLSVEVLQSHCQFQSTTAGEGQ